MQKEDIKLNNSKGIALITLVVAILMMLIISSVIVYNATSNIRIQSLNNMYNDIRVLNEQVFLYYSKYNELPILNEEYTSSINSDILGEYEANKFKIIDIDKIDRNIKSNLNYGEDYYNKNYSGTDIYIINTETLKIFYVNGIKIDDKIYYTIPNEEEYQKISVDEIIANPPELKKDFTSVIYSQNQVISVSNYDKNWYDYTELGDLSKWARAETTYNELYMWVPRFAYNKTTNEIVFLKGKTNEPIDTSKTIDNTWEIPSAFTDNDGNELTGIWLEISEYYEINSKTDLINKF